jgi:hypothetical protein
MREWAIILLFDVMPKDVGIGPTHPAEEPELLGRFGADTAIEREGEERAKLLDVRCEGPRRGRGLKRAQPEALFDPGGLFERQ